MEVTSITAPRSVFVVDHIKVLVLVAEGRSSEPVPLVPESWRRCMDHDQLDPSVLRPAVTVKESQFHDHRVAMEEQPRTARFGVEALYRQMAALGYVRLLTDNHGITVDHSGDEATTDNLREAGLNLGADRNEARMRRLSMSLPPRSKACHTCVGRRKRDGFLCALNRRLGFLSGFRRNVFVVTQWYAVCCSNRVTYEGAIAVT